MRISILALAALGLGATGLATAGCATMGSGATPREGSYIQQLDKLSADCTARGGILAPTGGQTGRPETDNVCKITGQPSRLTAGS